jgi:predicted ATPase
MITRLDVRAFKGLREFSITPQRVNLLIGANGTGKTNFTDLIAFIASLCPRGLSATIEEDFSGLERVRTRQPGAGTPFKLRIEFQLGEDPSRGIQQAHYRFALAQSKEIKVQEEGLPSLRHRPAGHIAL